MSNGLLVKPESSARWYDAAGMPVLEVPYADPSKGMRAVDLKDARKFNLYPSVTNVLSVVARPGLEAWKATQYIYAALTLPRLIDESLDDFAARVVEDGNTQRDEAADAGSRLHDLIESHFLGLPTIGAGEFAPHLEAFGNWWNEQGWGMGWPEYRFANGEHGFGGKVDMIARDGEDNLIIDWKTQETKPGKRIAFYDEWAMQLAGYALGTGHTDARLISVVVSRSEPGRIDCRDWTNEEGERERWIAAFFAALSLWKLRRNYYPGDRE